MDDGERTFLQSWGPRVLAPVAFFLAATILILLVNDAIEDGQSPASSASAPADTSPSATEPSSTGTVSTPGKRTYYRIKPGDTLETVANKKNTTVDDLIQLNPNIDPNNLQPGQRIRIS